MLVLYKEFCTQGCTSSPNIFKVYINDLKVAVEAAEQGDTVGEDKVSGLIFCGRFPWGYISETPDALRKQTETAPEYTRK